MKYLPGEPNDRLRVSFVKPTTSQNKKLYCLTSYIFGYCYSAKYDYQENKLKLNKMPLIATVSFVCFN